MPIVYLRGIGQDQPLDASGEDCSAEAGADHCQSLFLLFSLSRQSQFLCLLGEITYAVQFVHAPQYPDHFVRMRVE